MAIRSIAAQLIGLIGMAIPWSLHAMDYIYDPKVFAFLPVWCKYTPVWSQSAPGLDPEESKRLWRVMGPKNFMHIHHYCAGLFRMTRALYFEKTKAGRDTALTLSLGEYDYVLARVERTFPLIPEILTKKGETLVLLGRAEAVVPLHQAIELKSDYWPAYVALSDFFANIGNVEEARNWLRKGLEAAPNSQLLARRLAELDKNPKNLAPKNAAPKH